MSDHPPIPPNCPYFVWNSEDDEFDFRQPIHKPYVDGGGTGSVCIGLEGKGSQYDDPWRPEFYGRWRPIIAAVARCAWLDEQDKRIKELDMVEDHDGVLVLRGKWEKCQDVFSKQWEELSAEEDRRRKLTYECWENAEAWAAWGRGEEWKT